MRGQGTAAGNRYRIGVDIGGTFTDFVILNEATGELRNLKALSTPDDLSRSVIGLIEGAGVASDQIAFFAHGTTIGINAILERKGPRTGVITTEGFEDILELRRCARTHLLDPFMEKPWMFVPRQWRVGVTERVLFDGSIDTALDQGSAREALRSLHRDGVQSVAVCLLNAYANPAHEERLKAMVAEEFPGMYCTLSSEIVREIKEYERTSTTALNAYLLPVVGRYLTRLSEAVKRIGITADFYLMQSSGQLMSRSEAARKPVHTLESGPAGGAVASGFVAQLLGYEDAISLDMGGTTCKAAIIEGGMPRVTLRYELFEEVNKPGSGWPIRVPMIEILEIPVAGGSLSWVDEAGTFHVGPQSAGASPGPVCYDQGGEVPTVTDADTVLGRVEALLGGKLRLNSEKARAAVEQRIARPLGVSVEVAAAGIAEIADTRAADVVRQLTLARGRDPRDVALVAFGGAGPLHAARIVEELGMPEAIIPPVAGNFCAFGLLETDLGYDNARTLVMRRSEAKPEELSVIYRELEDAVTARLLAEGAPADRITLLRGVDMRYAGQLHEVTVPVPDGPFTEAGLALVEKAFHEGHLREFAYQSLGEPTELVTFRVRAVWRVQRPGLREIPSGTLAGALKKRRQVYFYGLERWVECPVYEREKLGQGCEMRGPAIVEEMSSTTLVPPSFVARVDQYGNLRLKVAS